MVPRREFTGLILSTIVAAALTAACSSSPDPQPPGAGAPAPAPAGSGATPPQPPAPAPVPPDQKINSHLLQEVRRADAGPAGTRAPSGGTVLRRDAAGRLLVDVRTESPDDVRIALGTMNSTVVSTSARDRSVIAWVPVGQIERLASLSAVRAIEPAAQATTNAQTGAQSGRGDTTLMAAQADVVVQDPTSARPVTVKVGQTLGIVNPEAGGTWQVDATGESLKLLTPADKMNKPGAAGWVWRAMAPGTSEIAIVSRVASGNPARFAMTIEIIRP